NTQSGPVGVLGLVAGAVMLKREPLGVLLAVFRPIMGEGMSAIEIQSAAQPVPAEPVRRLHLGALSVRGQPLVVRLRKAQAVEASLDAIVVAHGADSSLGQLRREAVREVRHRDGLPARYDLAEVPGPEVANSQLVLKESCHRVPSSMGVRGGAGVRAEQ